jgi:hypothetical protein
VATLRFASDGSRVSFNLPAAANFTGAMTFACLLRHRSIGAWSAIMNHGPLPTGASPAPNFEFDDLGRLSFDQVGTSSTGPLVNDVTNWYIVAITKAAGSTIPTFHYKRIDDASAWTHSAGSVALGNAPSQTGWLVNYGIWQASDQADMNLAVGAGWNTNLTNLQVEALVTNKATTDWTNHAVPPIYVHELTSKTTIPDLMGNGATLNSIAGTTLDTVNDPPSWTFGISPTFPPSVFTGIGLGSIGGGTIGIRATGATALTRSAGDALGFTETAVRPTRSLDRSDADTIGIFESAVRLDASPRAAADNIGITDAAGRSPIARVRTTQSSLAVVTDAGRAPVGLSRLTVDVLTLSEVGVGGIGRSRTTTDTLGGLSDAAAQQRGTTKTASDVVGVSSDSSRGISYARAVAEALAHSTTAQRTILRFRAATDNLAVTELASRGTTSRSRGASDPLSVTEALSRQVVTTRQSADTAAVSEFSPQTVGRSRSAADAIGLFEVTVGGLSYTTTAADSAGFTDSMTRFRGLPRSATDAVGTTETSSRTRTLVTRFGSSTLTISELATRAVGRPVSDTDTVGLSELASDQIGKTVNAVDAVGVTEASARAPATRARATTDNITHSSLTTKAAQAKPRTSAEAIGVTDTNTDQIGKFVIATDSVPTTDAATRAGAHPRAAADALAHSSAATRAAAARARTASDVIGVTEIASSFRVISVAASDALGFSDVTARLVLSRVRSIGNSLGVAEVVARAATARQRSAVEPMALSETLPTMKAYQRAASEATGVTEAATRATSVARQTVDLLTTGDFLDRQPLSLVRAALDVIGLSELPIATWSGQESTLPRSKHGTLASSHGELEAGASAGVILEGRGMLLPAVQRTGRTGMLIGVRQRR